MNHGAKKALLLFYRVIWYLPMIYFIAFWPFYFRAWMTLGHAPVSRLNDPKYYGLGRQHDITIWFLLAVFCSFLVCLFHFLSENIHAYATHHQERRDRFRVWRFVIVWPLLHLFDGMLID